MKRIRTLVYIVFAGGLGLGALFYSCSGQNNAQKIFEDVTVSSGISYTGMTFGAAWGDFDGDGLPDLYLTNHANPGSLYRNTGNGRFEDVTLTYFRSEDIAGDKHGSVWADFDNDGDQDLLVLRGGGRGIGAESNLFFVNNGDSFEEKSLEAGISNAAARSRMPLVYDFDGDSLLDLFLGSLERKDGLERPGIFLQTREGKFIRSRDIAEFATPNTPFCVAAEIDNDGFPDLICRSQAHNRTVQVLSMAKRPFTEIKAMPTTHFDDIALGDFNGDLLFDIYLARQLPERYAIILGQRGTNQAVADIQISPANADQKMGFKFEAEEDISLQVWPAYPENALKPEQIFIGRSGLHPKDYSFDLSAQTRGIQKAFTYEPGADTGLFIHSDPSGTWEVVSSANKATVEKDREKHSQVTLRISSFALVTDLEPIGEEPPPDQPPDRLLINSDKGLKEEGNKWDINDPVSGSSNVVTGDFDNDMDLDLYIVASGNVSNHDNILLLNDNHKRFIPVSGAGGASGGKNGVGDAAVTADFDMDGFLDLLVTNGRSMGRSWGLPARDGGYRLYRNIGNRNHWLQIDLEGKTVNRDGIGARVYVSAGGVTQVRMQDGGMHYRGQNHQRIHFGLGKKYPG